MVRWLRLVISISDSQRALLLSSHRISHRVIHGYYFTRLDKLDTAITITTPATAKKFWLYLVTLSDKYYPDIEITSRSQRTIYFRLRRVVAAHRVENDLSRPTGCILR